LIRLGVTREQLMETLGVCVYMGGGPALMYAAEAVRAYEEFLAAPARSLPPERAANHPAWNRLCCCPWRP
jgi:hypothetical protein